MELHSDHAFLLYALTDGEENQSRRFTPAKLNTLINGLPDNWTVAALVPDSKGRFEAKKAGFPEGNIEIWSTTAVGIETAGKTMTTATDTFMTNRAKGIRSTRNLFKMDMAGVSTKDVTSKLQELKKDKYAIYSVGSTSEIRTFIENESGKVYVKGSAYYRLDKPETVQASKSIAVRNRKSGKVYSGAAARQVLGLPDYEIRVAPVTVFDWKFGVSGKSGC